MSAVASCVAVSTSEWLTKVIANTAVMDTEISQKHPFYPLTSTVISRTGLSYCEGVFWEGTQGRAVENTGATITKSTMVSSRSKTESFFCSVLFLSPLSDITSESATKAWSWDQKAQNEVCLLSAARTVHHEKATNSQTRRHKSHKPPEGYFWEETEENKYVINRRLRPSRWIINESHREGLLLD